MQPGFRGPQKLAMVAPNVLRNVLWTIGQMDTTILLPLASFLVCFASYRLARKKHAFNPVPLFLVVFCCYNILPFLVMHFLPAPTELLLGSSSVYYGSESVSKIAWIVLACSLAALTGQVIGTLPVPVRPYRRAHAGTGVYARSNVKLLQAIFVMLFAAALGVVWQLRGFLFSGYRAGFAVDMSEVVQRGTLSSSFTLLFVAYLFLWYIHRTQNNVAISRIAFRLNTLAVLTIAVCLLSLGGRLYVASAGLTFLTAASAFPVARPSSTSSSRPRVPQWVLLTLMAIGSSLVGVWRLGGVPSIAALLTNMITEPLFVSISLASLVALNRIPVLSLPNLLLGDAVGLLPATIFPDKIHRLFAIRQVFAVESPLGGLNGLASLIANFGWLGAVYVILAISLCLTWISRMVGRGTGPRGLGKLTFIIGSTLPLLSLLRDPPVVSVYKYLLQNAICWPLALAFLTRLRLFPKRVPRGMKDPSAKKSGVPEELA